MDGRYAVFESFAYDGVRNVLLREGEPVALTPKALELLALLLERPGQVLAKDEVLEILWPGEFVQEGNLSQQVYLLRKALAVFGSGDLILTVPRRGYRFAAEVRRFDVLPAPSDARPYAGVRSRLARPLRVVAAAALVVALGTGFEFALRSFPAQAPAESARAALPPAAERAYRLGRYFYDEPPFGKMPLALAAFREVTRLAPRNPLGYAGIADTELRMAELSGDRHAEAGREYALKALRLAPKSAEAHVSYGCWLDWYARSPKAAAREFRVAVALAPGDPWAHEWAGFLELYGGDFAHSIADLREASRLDPTSFLISRTLGVAYYYSHEYALAVSQLNQTLALYPNSAVSRLHIAMALEQSGHADRALGILEHLSSKDFNPVELRAWIAYCRAKRGERLEAVTEADRIRRSPDRGQVAPSSLAAVYLAAGEPREAIALLQAAKLDVLTMWSPADSAALIPRFDPRLAMIYRNGRLQDLR